MTGRLDLLHHRRRVARRATGLSLVALLALVCTGCTIGDEVPPMTSFFTPAAPGETGLDTVAPSADSAEQEATDDDVAFVATMIVHHEQAVELAELAPSRAADPELAELASRMAVTQAAEADAMRVWLERRTSRDDAGGAHDHAEGMSGEISRSTIDRAQALDGAAFDRLFIEAMVPHHRGAVEMAETRLAEAGDPAVSRWARAIANAQSLEIDRLLEIEARLPAG